MSALSARVGSGRSTLGRSSAQVSYSSMGGGFGVGLGSSGGFGGTGASFGSGAGFGGAGGVALSGGGVIVNEKETMQDLNDRLANYLKRVKELEDANRELEVKLHDFTNTKTVTSHDYSKYEEIIQPLRDQILQRILENAHLSLEVDNARLAADDFRTKYETELALRQSVEADINGLNALKKEYVFNQKNLESDLSGLQDELEYLKKNHEEEIESVRSQVAGTVNVELDAAPTVDLQKLMDDMRLEYEATLKKTQREAEAWYLKQVEIKQVESAPTTQAIETSKMELTELRRSMTTLQSELDALLGMKASLEQTLRDTEARYAEQVNLINASTLRVQDELTDLRENMKLQSQEYQNLLNVKVYLENEIAKYKILLEGADASTLSGSEGQTTVSVKTTVTEIKK